MRTEYRSQLKRILNGKGMSKDLMKKKVLEMKKKLLEMKKTVLEIKKKVL